MASRRAPIDRIVDLAVAIPASTIVAARRAVPLAARVGALGTVKAIGRLSDAVRQLRQDDADAVEVAAVAEQLEAEAHAADAPTPPSSVDVGELAIDGYDDLAARQVVDRLEGLEAADLARIEMYEREHRNRSTVLGKISMLTQ